MSRPTIADVQNAAAVAGARYWYNYVSDTFEIGLSWTGTAGVEERYLVDIVAAYNDKGETKVEKQPTSKHDELLASAPHSDHYKAEVIRSIDFSELNKLSFSEGNVVKYVSRWRRKDGLKDLRKAEFYIKYLIQIEEERLASENQ